MNLVEQFISSINDDRKKRVMYCDHVHQSVKRHLDDLKKSKKKNYPFYLDHDAGMRAIKMAKMHRHTKGKFARKLFDLQPYQAFILYCLFGWKRKATNTRRFSKAYIETARKSGKSEFAAIIANILAFFDKEFGAEVYTAATKKTQAKIVFDRSRAMLKMLIQDDQRFSQVFQVGKHSISSEMTNSSYVPLSAEEDTEDGLFPHCAIIDEYHAHKTDGLVKVIETGTAGREQSLLFIITTAGFNINGPCYSFRKVAINVNSGAVKFDNVFAMIFTIDETDDWKDESCWIKANPNIGNTPLWHKMRELYTGAINEGAIAEIEFKTKNLNVWTSTSMSWISDENWMKCGPKGKEATPMEDLIELLSGRMCFGGLDLAAVKDLTAATLYFPATNDDKARTLHLFWLPEETLRQQSASSGVSYHQWVKDGFVRVTPGNAQDYDYIRHDLMMFIKDYDLKLTGFDPWNKVSIIPKLVDEGLEMFEHRQGYKSMSTPCKLLEGMVLRNEIDHGNNPVMRWMMSNVALSIDPAGNIKIDKAKSSAKVDGVVSLVMAISAAEYYFEEGPGESVYATRGILTLDFSEDEEDDYYE